MVAAHFAADMGRAAVLEALYKADPTVLEARTL
jgi:hypothetical protein